jgi:hypothetical protein
MKGVSKKYTMPGLKEFKDVVLITLDVGGSGTTTQINDIGITIFDTRSLLTLTPDSKLDSLIQTYQYKIDGAQEGRASQFGLNKKLAGEDVPEMFKNCMKYGSPEPSTRELRNTILL